jgi:chemotaxis signal transduction protein
VTQVVRFRAGAREYAVAIEHAREVRSAAGLRPLPEPRPDVVGVLPADDDLLPVVDPLGGGNASHVLVLEAGGRFGLLVDEVTGVVDVPASDLGPGPAGQRRKIIGATIGTGDTVVLVVDPTELSVEVTA